MIRLIRRVRALVAKRLQWKLTASYMAVIILTLFVMQLCLMGVLLYLLQSSNMPAPARAGELARAIALSLPAGLIPNQTEATEIQGRLDQFLLFQQTSPGRQKDISIEIQLQTAPERVVVLDSSRQVIATSDPAAYPQGSHFVNEQWWQWRVLIDRALAGETDIRTPGKLTAQDKKTGAYIAAYPLQSDHGEITGVVCADISSSTNNPLMGAAFFFVITTLFVLAASLLSAAIAGVFGFRFARRLTRPIQQLTEATQAIAAGDFTPQIKVDSADEVGQLAARFNDMSLRLAGTIADLNNQRRYAEGLLTSKQELMANVSHELRTPLASIRGHVESLLIRKARLSADEQDYLQIIQHEVDTLNRLIADLFELSRLETEKPQLNLSPLSVAEVITKTVRGLGKPAWEQHKVSLNVRLHRNLPLVLADGQRLHQILTNLIQNALRFTPQGGVVVIGARAAGDFVEITIRDTGKGIPPEDMPHIFERLFRAEKSRSRAHGGSGLGLAIVKQLVEAQGGTIRVESRPGEGSTFRFRLPRA